MPPVRRTRTQVTVDHDRGVFMISVAAELADMHPQTLRMYEARGLIEPQRSPKGTRLYSQSDVDQLRRIQEMTTDLGLNLAGVERVLELEQQLARAQERLEALERRAGELHAEISGLEDRRDEVRGEIDAAQRDSAESLEPRSTMSGEVVRADDVRPARTIIRVVRG